MVIRRFAASMANQTRTRTSSGRASSAYSRPWVIPAERVTTAATSTPLNAHIDALPSFSDHSLVPSTRGTMWKTPPRSAAGTQPKSMRLVWIGRSRPKRSQGTLPYRSGATSSIAASRPAVTATVIHAAPVTRYRRDVLPASSLRNQLKRDPMVVENDALRWSFYRGR
jgi:hypothetical protein